MTAPEPIEGEVVEAPYTLEEAQAKVAEIKSAINGFLDRVGKVLLDLHHRGAHVAYGLTWAEFVGQEFGITARRSYQLLAQGRVNAEIERAMGTAVPIPEWQAREIKNDVPAVVEAARVLVEAGEAPGKAVEAAVKEVQDRRRADRKAERDRKAAEKAETKARHEHIREEGRARLAALEAEKQAARDACEAAKPARQREAEQRALVERRASAIRDGYLPAQSDPADDVPEDESAETAPAPAVPSGQVQGPPSQPVWSFEVWKNLTLACRSRDGMAEMKAEFDGLLKTVRLRIEEEEWAASSVRPSE